MSTEREMLEAAARAMGWRTWWVGSDLRGYVCHLIKTGFMVETAEWRPREDGADSFELAAALRISVEHNHPEQEFHPWVMASIEGPSGVIQIMEDVPDESQRADRMRLAILRCAAAQAPKEGV
jgi:hypothetical protein